MMIVKPFNAAPCLLLLSLIALLSACSSPPKPPTVDEAHKRPANAQVAVELLVCKNDLHNTRILATESGRLADTTSATLAHLAARQQLLAALQAPPQPSPPPPPSPSPPLSSSTSSTANSIYTVHFAFGSTRVVIPTDMATTLLLEAKAAPLVLLRGRTDGTTDAPAESRTAQARAAAMRDYLVAAGVDPARIRTTYQPSGDQVADNRSPQGRDLNRRVEIEIYRVLPVAALAMPLTQP